MSGKYNNDCGNGGDSYLFFYSIMFIGANSEDTMLVRFRYGSIIWEFLGIG